MNRKFDFTPLIAIALFTILLNAMVGCVSDGNKAERQNADISRNASGLDERLSQDVWGAADALERAPTNAPVNLAKELLKDAQQITDPPTNRIPVQEILNGLQPAIDDLKRRFDHTEQLLGERAQLRQAKAETDAKLVAMGKLYEAEKRKHIVRRIWEWAIGTLGIGGIIAACVFCPALIPVFFRIAVWIGGKIPAVASALGAVSLSAYDSVIKGVQKGRDRLKENPDDPKGAMDLALGSETHEHEILINHRKTALALKRQKKAPVTA